VELCEDLQQKARPGVFTEGHAQKKAQLQNKISDKSLILDDENWSKSIIFASIIRFILILLDFQR
jgi:hypothetical protein